MLKLLEKKDFSKVYEIMEQSFPKEEYRSYEGQLALMERECYRIYGEEDSVGVLRGFMAVWDLGEYCFLEHFAVSPMERNGGLGTAMLRELRELYSSPICLEVEPPKDELTCRRVGFYQRNEFHLNPFSYEQPSLGAGRRPVSLQIMTTGNPLTREAFYSLKETLYTRVYSTPL